MTARHLQDEDDGVALCRARRCKGGTSPGELIDQDGIWTEEVQIDQKKAR